MSEKVAMATERTPLIQTVPAASPRQRYPHHTTRRICTALFATVLAIALLLLVVPGSPFAQHSSSDQPHLLDYFRGSYPSSAWPRSNGIEFEDLQQILLDTPREKKAREWSKYYTAGPHLAGQNQSQAQWTRDLWQSFGVKSEVVSYDVYVNYPRDHGLVLQEEKDGKKHVKYRAKLEEDVLKEDGTSGLKDRIPTFHGYSASGNVTGQYVWVNYGTYDDYEKLIAANVSLEGKIALAKYGGIFRGLKVKRAQELGAIGCILYSDPGDDGKMTEEHGEKPYPKGGARNPSSVQRGSVSYLSYAPGDPTTPGYPSLPGVPRAPVSDAIPSIPSVPISYEDALPLLKALNGHGPQASSFGDSWTRGNGLGYKGVKYNIGPSPPELTLNLMNDQEYVTTPMWDVIGIINGTIPDEVVILGNHRDAWIAGGAGDPNSGSAALNEVVRSICKAVEAGWKPLRTIVFASWDGEEYALIGSTEWVEEYLPWLNNAGVAYLNVDVATSGSKFIASAAPLLNKELIEATKLVPSPNQTVKGESIYDTWDLRIRTIGSGSDFTAFQDFAGIPCIDFAFAGGADGTSSPNSGSPVYHYHSNYDSFDWMDRFGDPGFHYHVAAARIWGLLAAKLAEKPIISFSASEYARALHSYTEEKKKTVEKMEDLSKNQYDFSQLDQAISDFKGTAEQFDSQAAELSKKLEDAKDLPWYKWWKKVQLYHRARAINNRYKSLERNFLYTPGLDGRSWFKHTVFAPGLWTGYAGDTFPGIVESLDEKDIGRFYKWQGIIANQIRIASTSLEL